MKKKNSKRSRANRQQQSANLTNHTSMIQRIIELLRRNINIAVITVVLTGGGVYFAYSEWNHARKAQDTNITVTIGDIEIENGTIINVQYMLPPEEYESQNTGILPFTLINKNEYDAENFKFWIETEPFENRKKVLELNASGKYVEKEKKMIRGNRFWKVCNSNYMTIDRAGISRECFIFSDVFIERVEYKIPNFNALSVHKIEEGFKIDPNAFQEIENTSLCKDSFIIDLIGNYKNNKTIYESRLYVHICKNSSLEKLVEQCRKFGFWGGGFAYDRYKHSKLINFILICPNYYIEDNKLQIDMNNANIYSITYKLGTFFRKRQLIIKDNKGNILNEYKFKDSKETKQNIDKIFFRRKDKAK